MSRKLERALNGILRDYGHDVFLQRKTPDGTNWTKTLEKHTVRHRYPAIRGLPQIMQERAEGLTHIADMVYYFKPDAHPNEGDRVYEYDPRFDGRERREPRIDGYGQTTWLIDFSLPMRGKHGKIVFFVAGMTREEPN